MIAQLGLHVGQQKLRILLSQLIKSIVPIFPTRYHVFSYSVPTLMEIHSYSTNVCSSVWHGNVHSLNNCGTPSALFNECLFVFMTLCGAIHYTYEQTLAILFIHSFILDISIAPLQVHYHSEALLL